MAGGVVILVARGLEDVFLTGDANVTFFKSIYRRYTNFSLEPVFQNFDQDNIRLGQKVTCTLSREGDLCNWIYVAIELPPIPEYIADECVDPIKKFAWARKLGFVLIKYVDIEIGGHEIDRQYGEWMNMWAELAHTQNRGLDNMIGNLPELYEFSNGKDQQLLYIPLFFWFCRHSSASLPLVSMHYNDVKIHVQFNDPQNCYILGPTSSILVIDDVVHFQPFEIIYQVINNHYVYGIFINFDPVTRTLYYIEINDTSQLFFMGLDTSSITQKFGVTEDDLTVLRQDYLIFGAQSNYSATPQDNQVEHTIQTALPPPLLNDIVFLNCQLDCLYIYLDADERARFTSIPHEYLIEQMQFIPDKKFNSSGITQKLGLDHPVKEIYWVIQYAFMYGKLNDWFNYTDTPYRDKFGKFTGNSLMDSASIYLNAQRRIASKNFTYYNYVQPYQNHSQEAPLGLNMYSFSIFPENGQFSGSCNMSRINDISLKTLLTIDADLAFTITQRAYAMNYNVLRILGGLAGVLFNN